MNIYHNFTAWLNAYGHSPVNLLHIYLSEHIFIRTPLKDCFQHNKRNSINMSMNQTSFFISASYSVAPCGRYKWFIAARRYNTSRFSKVKWCLLSFHHFFNFSSCLKKVIRKKLHPPSRASYQPLKFYFFQPPFGKFSKITITPKFMGGGHCGTDIKYWMWCDIFPHLQSLLIINLLP